MSSLTPLSSADVLDLLLIEDDLADALLVGELLDQSGMRSQLTVARDLAQARLLLAGAPRHHCVLADLGLPDAQGLGVLTEILDLTPRTAVLVLTGLDDHTVATSAVAAGAEDYLVKRDVDAALLARAIRYAIERKRADEAARELVEARVLSQENARLERGLLPVPLLKDPSLDHHARYLPGHRGTLLGGDFHDTIQTDDGAVHLVVGDVSGHGEDEASLGVRLRMTWRALVLAGRTAPEVLTTMNMVATLERSAPEIFTTVCMVTIDRTRKHALMHRAGHPRPLIIKDTGVAPVADDACGPALGLFPSVHWPRSTIDLGDAWGLMLYTDGLIEGFTGDGTERLDIEGLTHLTRQGLTAGHRGEPLIDFLLTEVERMNHGALPDDLAVVLLNRPGATDPAGRR